MPSRVAPVAEQSLRIAHPRLCFVGAPFANLAQLRVDALDVLPRGYGVTVLVHSHHIVGLDPRRVPGRPGLNLDGFAMRRQNGVEAQLAQRAPRGDLRPPRDAAQAERVRRRGRATAQGAGVHAGVEADGALHRLEVVVVRFVQSTDVRLNPAAPELAQQGSDLFGEGVWRFVMTRGEVPRPFPIHGHGPAVAVGCPSLTRRFVSGFELEPRWKSAARTEKSTAAWKCHGPSLATRAKARKSVQFSKFMVKIPNCVSYRKEQKGISVKNFCFRPMRCRHEMEYQNNSLVWR